jgi:uncharacterized protein (TIGR02145 family)
MNGDKTLTANFQQQSQQQQTYYLNENVPVSGNISGVNEVKYSMAVTSGLRYRVYWGDTDNGGGSADVGVGAYYSNGSEIFKGDYSSSNSQQFTASSSGTVEIRVYPLSSGSTGTFTIGFEVVSGGGPPSVSYGPNVNYGGETYQTVVIGSQTWFARNLNYDVPNDDTDKCFEDNAEYCEIYGRMYSWNTALTACPADWHLPTDDEWLELMNFVGESPATKLKSPDIWDGENEVDVGTDDYGFSALPGGRHGGSQGWRDLGVRGNWWTATEYDAAAARSRSMRYSGGTVYEFDNAKIDLHSVRCVKN